MKVKIQAGAEIDTLTKDELSNALDEQTKAYDKMLSEGLMYAHMSVHMSTLPNQDQTVDGYYKGGSFSLGGPEAGYVWSVKNVTYFNLDTGADLFINGSDYGSAILVGSKGNGTTVMGAESFVIKGGQTIIARAVSTTAAKGVFVLWYLEVPNRDIGKL